MRAERRAGKAVAAVLLLIAVVLHAPWTGYTTQVLFDVVTTPSLLARCPTVGQGPVVGLSHQALVRRFDQELACAQGLLPEPSRLKWTRWRTHDPIVSAFGRVRNMVGGLLLLAALTGAWCWWFRDRKRGDSSRAR